jgi:4-amino-4-deoxy-L-arabinose transferase-like glycosyltransferase
VNGPRPSGVSSALVLVAVCAIPTLLFLPFLTEPFTRDEGFYAVVGRGLLHGDVPYRDSFDNKPPVVFLCYAFSFLLLGANVWAPRLLVALLLSLTNALIYIEGKLLSDRRAGLVAAIAFALSVGLARLGTDANTEYFLVLPMTAGLVAYTLGRKRQSAFWFAASGFANGIAILTKETALFPFALLVAYEMWNPSDADKRLANVGAMVAGSVMAGAAVLVPIVAAGGFGDFWDAAVVYTLKYVGDETLLARLVDTFLPVAFVLVAGPWVLLSVFAIVRARRVSLRDNEWLVIGWALSSVAAISFVGRFYPHYYFQLMPGLSLLVPLGLPVLGDLLRSGRVARLGWLTVMVCAVLIATALSLNVYLRTSDGRHTAKTPNDDLAEFETRSEALADYITANTKSEDLIYNLGFQPELYFYADRRSPTKFYFDRPFAVDRAYVEEAARDLEAHPPAYIIDSAKYDPWEPGRYDAAPIRSFMAERYELVGKIEYADVYKLK